MSTLVINTDSDKLMNKSVELVKVEFTCPHCGTRYKATDPGFIPNCYNCGSIMRKG